MILTMQCFGGLIGNHLQQQFSKATRTRYILHMHAVQMNSIAFSCMRKQTRDRADSVSRLRYLRISFTLVGNVLMPVPHQIRSLPNDQYLSRTTFVLDIGTVFILPCLALCINRCDVLFAVSPWHHSCERLSISTSMSVKRLILRVAQLPCHMHGGVHRNCRSATGDRLESRFLETGCFAATTLESV
jgi:hypothetical protein